MLLLVYPDIVLTNHCFTIRMSHSFNNDFSNTPEKERGLQQIKSEFNAGEMQAFKGSCSFQKLEKVTIAYMSHGFKKCMIVYKDLFLLLF